MGSVYELSSFELFTPDAGPRLQCLCGLGTFTYRTFDCPECALEKVRLVGRIPVVARCDDPV